MDSINIHDRDAGQYDRQAEAWGWNPEIFFGLMWEYVNLEDRLLDVGIGTGLCSKPFVKAGVGIHGFDASEEMLGLCKAKHVADDLKVHDVEDVPWPYPEACFDHIIAGGVFHFFGSLKAIFKEIVRLLAKEGVFGFNISMFTREEWTHRGLPPCEPYAKVLDEASGARIYKHSESYIQSLLEENGMSVEKKLTFLASLNPQTLEEHYSTLFVARQRR
ncbi:MAG: class I SAM-dependent methyltransferase [Deltaproteobacteria bacterium]|nr:class I SAM-dependent methyltransferase [Deltaproteobacteria bacterium]MBW2677472.1 class I SAM-dependent methyltransferase [Deltaproteobacteria bacterium]